MVNAFLHAKPLDIIMQWVKCVSHYKCHLVFTVMNSSTFIKTLPGERMRRLQLVTNSVPPLKIHDKEVSQENHTDILKW